MLVFPNCKINLGLLITQKREDGFHNIETIFYPLNWCDALEVIEHENNAEPFIYSESGLAINSKKEDNLIYKAWQLLHSLKPLPPIKVHLHKVLPMGAGLGGGSADAAFFINLVNKKFDLKFSIEQKETIASKLGSDCSFFINNKPVLATGKGNEFSEVKINLSKYYILVVYPNIHSNTKDAYNGIKPKLAQVSLKNTVENENINTWKNLLINDFEETIFKMYPEIKQLKEKLYANGALYASMSGSGSSVFGIFEYKPNLTFDANYTCYLQEPQLSIL